MSINVGRDYICSECGRPFIVKDTRGYKYVVIASSKKIEQKEFRAFQCSYTCYDHALLRIKRQTRISNNNFNKYVTKSEQTMKGQGKEVLHPIELKPWSDE